MFSIEKTLEEIVSFIKKFFVSTYSILFITPDQLQNKVNSKIVIKPSLYVLISLFLFLAFIQLNLTFITEPFYDIFTHYVDFINGKNVETNILYILPSGIIIYLLVQLTAGLFFKNTEYYQTYRSYCFYWIGTSLLLYITIQFLIIGILTSFRPVDVSSINKLNGMLFVLHSYAYTLPLVFPLLPLFLLDRNTEQQIKFKYLVVPVLAVGSILLCIKSLAFIIEHSELKPKQNIDLLNKNGDHKFSFEVKCWDKDCDTVQVSSNIIVRNLGDSPMFIQLNDLIFVKAFVSDKDNVEWRDAHQTSLAITKIDRDSIAELKILKPGDLTVLHCSAKIGKADWYNFIKAAKHLQSNEYKALFQYFGISANRENYSFDSDVIVQITQ